MAQKKTSTNPYIELDAEFQDINTRYKQVQSELAQWHEKFLKTFAPDQTEFDNLKDQAKDLQWRKAPQMQIDTVYLKMAMIYKRWLPIEVRLHQMNPTYHKLFDGLKALLEDVEKNKKKPSKKKIV